MKSNKQRSISMRRLNMWRRYVSLLVAMVLVMGNVLPAISEGIAPSCGKTEHTHTAECFAPEPKLNCGKEETEGHVHGDSCYNITTNPICTLEETAGHKHDDSCKTTIYVPDCGVEAGAEAHTHNAAECYETVTVVCPLEESEGHVHEDACYETNSELTCEDTTEGHTHAEGCYTNVTTTICGKTEGEGEHKHNPETCTKSETVLKCEIQENPGHQHTDACNVPQENLICTLEESEGHTHGEGCTETVKELICQLPEVEAHVHSDECNITEDVLVCTQEVHSHTAECYPAVETEPVKETNKSEEVVEETKVTEAPRDGEPVYMGGYIQHVTVESRAVGTTEWKMIADKVADNAADLTIDDTDELKLTIEYKIPGASLTGTTAIDYTLPLKSNEAVIQAKEEVIYALDKVTPIGKAVTGTDGTVTITFGEEYLKANDNGTEITGTYQFLANASELTYSEEGAAIVDFLQDEINPQAVAVQLGFAKVVEEVSETDTPESNADETNADETNADETNADETEESEVIVENVVTFQANEGATVLVDSEDVTNNTALAKNGTIYFEVQVAEGYELVTVIVDGEKNARLNPDNPEEYIIENIQTDETIVVVTTKSQEREIDEEGNTVDQTVEPVLENVVTFATNEGAKVLVDDIDVATTDNTAMAENGTIYFTVQVEEGYELIEVVVDGTIVITPDEITGEYRIGNIQTDATIVTVSTLPILKSQNAAIGEITVTYAEGAVEKGAQLKVNDEIPNLENVSQAINEKLAEKFEETAALRPFDINLTNIKGKAAEVTGEVTVNVALAEPVNKEKAEEIGVEVYQVTDEGNAEEVMDITYTEEVNGGETTITGFSFTTTEAAPYVFVEKETITVDYLTDEGETYEISVDISGTENIPASATLAVQEVTGSEYDEYVVKAAEAIGTDVEQLSFTKLFDITIMDGETEIQPDGNVTVEIKLKDEVFPEVQVIHFGEITEVLNANVEENTVKFETNGFSIYAVVGEGNTGAYARMKINFYGVDQTTPVATIYVKNQDMENIDTDAGKQEQFEIIVSDPGVGNLASNEVFKGWTTEKDYTEDTASITIEDIRESVKGYYPWEDGEVELNYYGMIFKSYVVSYVDEDNVVIKTDVILGQGDSVSYTVDLLYTPKNQDDAFKGWYATDATSQNISGESPYVNGSAVSMTGNVTLTASPAKGYWLSFNENGQSASYTAPQFVEKGTVTVKPSAPTRNGYTFGGWYTDVDCTDGNEFTFGQELNTRTDLYAKWNPVATAQYSVIIWQQRVNDDKNAADADKTYDVAEVITLTGNVGSTIDTVTRPNSNTNVNGGRGTSYRNISVNGTQKSYTGFHAARYDENVQIAPEGTTVLNVYYDRNLITMTFDAGSRYIKNYTTTPVSFSNTVTYTGLFDAPLSFTWPSTYWRDSTGTGTTYAALWEIPELTLSFYGSFKLYTPTKVTETLELTSGGSTPIRFIRQKVDGTWPTSTDDEDHVLIVNMNANSFNFSEKYAGFSVYQYRKTDYTTSDTGWTSVYSNGSLGSTSNYSQLNIRFLRNKYKINYLDGTYYDGDGNILQEATETPLNASGEIYYEASVASYNKDGSDYYNPTAPAGYTFGGWYTDSTCTKPYTFTTMPIGGITVYAKWVKTQYRVFLHPNVPESDDSLAWGQTNQAMNFRVDYGEKVADGVMIRGDRDEYELIGWYMDPECTIPFNFDAYTLNDTTVTAVYDKTVDMTDVMNKYGNIDGTGTNSDTERFWITKKLDLYAKWRSKLEGANGILIKYDAVEGEGQFANGKTFAYATSTFDIIDDPEQGTQYADQATVVGYPAATATRENEEFKYWVLQTWDEETETYVDKLDTDGNPIKIYPGQVFTALKADARQEITETDNAGVIITATYTIQLRAEYGKYEEQVLTHIYWYANNGTDDVVKTNYVDEARPAVEEFGINEAVTIKPADTFSYPGHTFLGWARLDEGEDPADLTKDDLFLTYHSDTGKYSAVVEGETITVEKVASDGQVPSQNLYAVWEAKTYKVTVKKFVDGLETDVTKSFTFTPTIGGKVGEEFTLTGAEGSNTHEVNTQVPYGTKISVSEEALTDFTVTAVVTVKNPDTATYNVTTGYTNGAEIEIHGDTEIIFTNTRNRQHLLIKKVGDDVAEGLGGAVFSLGDYGTLISDTETATLGNVYYESGNMKVYDIVLPVSSSAYTLSEITAPTYYEKIADVSVMVLKDNVSINSSDGGAVLTENDGVYTITVTDIRKKATVTITKNVIGLASDQNTEFGFTVSGLNSGDKAVNLVGDTSSYKHSVTYENVPYGTVITVTETENAAFDTQYTVNSGDATDGRTAGFTVEGNTTVTFTNTRNRQPVKFMKVDSSNNSITLAGAEFTINGEEANYSMTSTTGTFTPELSDGEAYFYLPVGDYELIETKAPNGYIMPTSSLMLHVGVDGVSYGSSETAELDGEAYLIIVENKAGVALPATGGTGTTSYTIGGLLTILSASFFLMYNNKKRRKEGTVSE